MRIPPGSLAFAMVGLGLIVLGGASAVLLSNRAADEALLPTDFSAIPVSVRYNAPALALRDLAGTSHALSDYAGEVVLVNLWATWCPPCQAEMPILQSFFEKHRTGGFTVVGVEDGESAADVKAFVRANGLTFPIWLDPAHEATDQAFKTVNLPSSYVISRAGEVRLRWLGAISAGNLEKYVTPIIQER